MNFDLIKEKIKEKINKIYNEYELDVQKMSNINNVNQLFMLENEKINNYSIAIEKEIRLNIKEDLEKRYDMEKIQVIIDNKLTAPTFEMIEIDKNNFFEKDTKRNDIKEKSIKAKSNKYSKERIMRTGIGTLGGTALGYIFFSKISVALMCGIGGTVGAWLLTEPLKDPIKSKLEIESTEKKEMYREELNKAEILRELDIRKKRILSCLFNYVDNIESEILKCVQV